MVFEGRLRSHCCGLVEAFQHDHRGNQDVVEETEESTTETQCAYARPRRQRFVWFIHHSLLDIWTQTAS
jgi:hypothetical protein